ncbi:MAG: KpsF/GutQ family sugar-phosphate isomerase [Elusimicrobiota bacterium]
MSNCKERAKEILNIESKAVSGQVRHINNEFEKAVDIIYRSTGRVAVVGIGKSGLIGRKIAATMSSVGIPALFLHPAECLHGDIGMLMPDDVILALSYTGESDEIKKVVPVFRNMGAKIVVITGHPSAKIWKQADSIINSRVEKEACSYNLAPTASTTAMLAMGDALALCAAEKKGFRKEHLERFHPGGGIGKKLTTKVKDIMRTGKNNPLITENHTVNEALLVMTRTRLGATSVTNKAGRFVGFFTDGDLRRKLQTDKKLLQRKISSVMTRSPLTIGPDTLAVEAAKILKKHNFDNIPVVNKNSKPVGILDERDLLAEGI